MPAEHKPTQTDRLHAWLKERGAEGVHTFEMRRAFMGNPSQRRQELADRGIALVVGPRERLNGNAMGVRIWLAEHAPARLGGGQHPMTEITETGAVRMAV